MSASSSSRVRIDQSKERPVRQARVASVMAAAQTAGLLGDGKSSRIGARVSPRLLAQAKRLTGLSTDSELIAFALANVALEETFSDAFKRARGALDADTILDV